MPLSASLKGTFFFLSFSSKIQASFAITQSFTEQANSFIATKMDETQNAKKKLEEGNLTKGEEDKLNQIIRDNAKYEMGGTGHIILTALTGAASGNVTGSSAQFAQAAAINVLQSYTVQEVKTIADNFSDKAQSEAVRTALQALTACAGAGAKGGDCSQGAMGAASAVVLANVIDGMKGEKAIKEWADGQKESKDEEDDPITKEGLFSNLVTSLIVGITEAAGGDSVVAGWAGKTEVENNYLITKDVEKANKAYEACGSDKSCQMQVVKKTNELSQQQSRELDETKRQIANETAEKMSLARMYCQGDMECQGVEYRKIMEEAQYKMASYVNMALNGTDWDKIETEFYPDNTKALSFWEGFTNTPEKIVDSTLGAYQYFDDKTLKQIGDDIWQWANDISQMPGKWLDKAIPADSFEAAASNLGTMTAHEAGEGFFYGALETTAILGGVSLRWVDGKWVEAKVDDKPLNNTGGLNKGPNTYSNGNNLFANEVKLQELFERHGAEFEAKSVNEYLSIASDVIQNGVKVQYVYKGETRIGFVQFMGTTSKGQPKFAFVGTNNQGLVTTLHAKSGKDFWKTLNGNSQDKTIYPVQ